jgi:hypothetical protein
VIESKVIINSKELESYLLRIVSSYTTTRYIIIGGEVFPQPNPLNHFIAMIYPKHKKTQARIEIRDSDNL